MALYFRTQGYWHVSSRRHISTLGYIKWLWRTTDFHIFFPYLSPALFLACNHFTFTAFGRLCGMSAAQQCYAPNGSPTSDVPCDTGSSPTFCCPSGTKCQSNGLCQNTGGQLSRGSCTDETYESQACTQQCIGGMSLCTCS